MASSMDRTQEQITSPSLIRLWSRRMTLAGEEPLDMGLLEDIFPPAQLPHFAPTRCVGPKPKAYPRQGSRLSLVRVHWKL
uniref:Uncharacterized protein n=1 Tax=Timema douglasi TaxID=61478 RepID=A0A7R8ZEJ5_TIMDO|nr:unnamed protein product [Timema douglasi]